jgi:hypothetical protein
LLPWCKVCYRKKQIAYYNEHKEEQWARHKKWHQAHKEYGNNRDRQRRLDNPEKKQEYQLEYQRKNPEKMNKYSQNRKLRNHEITKQEWQECKQYFNNSCAYCGMSYEEHKVRFKQDLNKEHVEHEGSNKIDNCIPACKSCNGQKWKYQLDEWFNKENPKYTEERYLKIISWLNKFI